MSSRAVYVALLWMFVRSGFLSAFIVFWALWHVLFFLVKQNVKDIFINGHRTKKQQKKVTFRNRLKKLNFDKTFEDIIENELDFHGYGTAKL